MHSVQSGSAHTARSGSAIYPTTLYHPPSYQLGFIEIVAVYLACWYCGGSWVHYVTVQNLASAEESVTY